MPSFPVTSWQTDENMHEKPVQNGERYDGSNHEENNGWTRTRYLKISETVLMTFSMMSLGLFLEITGPSLPYLKDRIRADYEQVSRVLVARSVGYFVGSIGGGYLCDRFSNWVELFFAGSYAVAAIGTTFTPLCHVLPLMGTLQCAVGVAQGWICTGCNALAMQLWREDSAAPLISQHLAFGVGALIAPQLVNAFSYRMPVDLANSTFITSTFPSVSSTTGNFNKTVTKTVADIEYPHLISGIFTMVFAVGFLVCFLYIRKTHNSSHPEKLPTSFTTATKSTREILDPGSCAQGDTCFGFQFFILLFILYIHIVGGERAYSKFISSFAQESTVKLQADEANNLNSAFWFSFTAGRLVNTIVAKWCPLVPLMIILVVANIVNGIVLALWASTDALILWVFSCFYGFFMSPLFSTGLVWANQYVEMTAVGVSIPYVGSAVGGMVYQWLTGYLFEYHGPPTLMYVIAGFAANLALMYVILQIISGRRGTRFSKTMTDFSVAGTEVPNIDSAKFRQTSTL